MSAETWDVVIVGGGAAGMSAALILAQARRSVLVLETGLPRNRFDDAQHGYLSRDGLNPAELVALGRAEAESYGAVVRRAEVVDGSRSDDGFVLRTSEGDSIQARRVLVATGLTDTLPDVEGIEPFWGHEVFHCPYCHGCEIGDHRVGVLAVGEESIAEAHLMLQWADHVTLLLNDTVKPTSAQLRGLDARGIPVVEGKVVAAEVSGDRMVGVRLASGEVVELDELLVCPATAPNRELLDALGVEVSAEQDKHGVWVPSDDSGLSSVPGVWVAGNVRDGNAQVIDAAAQGLKSAIAINADLTVEQMKTLEEP